MSQEDHWLPGFDFNVEEWDAKGQTYETLAICRTLALPRAAFAAASEKPARRFMIRSKQDAGGTAAPRGRLVRTNTGAR